MSDVPQTTTTTETAPTPSTETPTPTTETTNEPRSLINEGEPKTPETPAPEPFDAEKLTLPEGFEKNETFTAFGEWAKEAGIDHPNAQKLIDMYAAQAAANAKASNDYWTKTNEDWQREVKNDPELGGDKLQGHLQTISKLLNNPEFVDPKFREALDFTGAGNHPAVVRTLARIAKALTEGASVAGNPPGGQGQRPPSLAEALYPGGPRRDLARPGAQ